MLQNSYLTNNTKTSSFEKNMKKSACSGQKRALNRKWQHLKFYITRDKILNYTITILHYIDTLWCFPG